MRGPALARHFVPAGDVDHVDGVVGQLPAVLGGQVVAAALHEEQLGVDLLHQLLQSEQVVADVLNGDGKLDLVTASGNANKVSVLIDTGCSP